MASMDELQQQVALLNNELSQKNKQLEVESALERVRARTMAMQKQDDLFGVLELLVEQLLQLGVQLDVANFSNGIPEGDWDLWVHAVINGSIFSNYVHFPRIEHPFVTSVDSAIRISRKNGTELSKAVFTKEEKDSWFHHLYSNTIYRDITPVEIKQVVYASPGYNWSVIMLEDTWVSIARYNTIPFTEEEDALLKRFAKAFGQAYTRFLDLKKAEEQAREAQIQLSLERVRARTMAMQKSEDMNETASEMFKQIQSLGMRPWACGFNIFDNDEKVVTQYMSLADGGISPPFRTPLTEDPFFISIYDARQRRDELLVMESSGKELADTYRYMFGLPGSGEIFGDLEKSGFEMPRFQITHCAYFSQGYLVFITYEHVPEAHDIFKRFAKTFEQTYTRFLDLQKAEEQAREAEIQLALERVRARTMAMQRSDELSAVIQVIYEQLVQLNFVINNAGFGMDIRTSDDFNLWMADPLVSFPIRMHIPCTDHSQMRFVKEAKEKKLDFATNLLGFEEKNSWFEYVYQFLPGVPEEVKEVTFATPGLATSAALMKNVFLYLLRWDNIPYSDEENAILLRFGKTFEQTYTRFLDLEKAETQAREAQIELALERVRARTIAMQKSDELADVVSVVFDKLRELQVAMDAACITTFVENSTDIIHWVANPDLLSRPLSIKVPYWNHPIYNLLIDARKKQIGSYTLVSSFEEKNDYWNFLFQHSDYKYLDDKLKDLVLGYEGWSVSTSVFQNSATLLVNYSKKEFSEQDSDIVCRFGKVFEQAYIRFLDLEKAEAQARESQIQAALERVRSRSMGMQKSDELRDVIQVIYEQLVQLNFEIINAGFLMDYRETDDYDVWTTDAYMEYPNKIRIAYFDHPVNNDYLVQKEKGPELFTKVYPFEEKNKWLDSIWKTIVGISEETKKAVLNLPALSITRVLMEKIGLYLFNYSSTPYSDAENATLLRFAKAFEQTYTRFKDLQKAEAQARESQIQAALERVRSRSMGMQKSEELRDVIRVLFEQLVQLHFGIHNAGFLIDYRQSDDYKVWMGDAVAEYPTLQHIPYFDHVINRDFIAQKNNGAELFTKFYSFEEKNSWLEVVFSYLSGATEELKAATLSLPAMVTTRVLLKNIGLYLINYSETPYTEAENVVITRFAKEFEQVYTRFNDLKQAEEQLRESQIQAALERVRSRSMGMQKSEELREVIHVIYEQLIHLGLPIHGAGFTMDYRDTDDFDLWSADSLFNYPVKLHIPYFDHPLFNRFSEAKRKGLAFYDSQLTYAEKNTFWDHFFKYAPQTPPEAKEAAYQSPGFSVSNVLFNNVALYIFNFSGNPFSATDNAVLMRFGKEFEQLYTRFNDLKNAEEQALEAIKRASVDRVRAEIASMRTTNDLKKITPLIWNELTTLGVPFIRCGVFIMDEETQEVQSFLSTPEGTAIAGFRMPYFTTVQSANIVTHWRQKKMFRDYMDEAAFAEYTKNLLQYGAITSGEKYLTENRPTDLYLHFLPFLQGMLYTGNTEPLDNDALQLMQNLADAFSTAYARYEDFNKLEAAKQQIEKTLTELKDAQRQLIQSEKMASLGELTAGIAHEIQNPLNFVNNFSDINAELIEEQIEALRAGQIDDAIDLANDIRDNEAKISHHGKRADGIVKGMLQHSRSSTGVKEPSDINKIVDEYLRLSYHGMRAKDKSFNADFNIELDEAVGSVNVIPQDIGRVLLNLFNNAFYAVNERRKKEINDYKPTVTVRTQQSGDQVMIRVADNGTGMPQKVVDKIFQPFFTTKPTGSGTGLGLSLSYDIVKAHGGEIKVESKEGERSEFVIQLPNV